MGGFDLFTNATYGEGFDGDNVYGVVIMPSKELIEDKLEAVVRYQWARSEGDNLLKGSKRNLNETRELVVDPQPSNLSNILDPAEGDENHTIYAGLNYFLCDHNAKLMTGVEYETIDGGERDAEATTFWLAARMYF